MPKACSVLPMPACDLLVLAMLSSGFVACGGVDPSAGPGGGGAGGTAGAGGTGTCGEISDPSVPILPWAPGNTWTYRVTDAIAIESTKTTTIGAEEMVGGVGPNATTMALKVTTEKSDATDLTESWQAAVDGKVVRYRERGYSTNLATGQLVLNQEDYWDPYKLHADGTAEHTQPGAAWVETYSETKLPVGGTAIGPDQRTDAWSVVNPSECVEVLAGTFDDAIHFMKGAPGSASGEKHYWYVRGVGKVKETGTQTEELMSYEVAP